MNAAHLHVLVNHMPMAFAIMALFAMVIGLVGKNASIKKLSMGMMVCVALAAAAAYYSGGGAEEMIASEQYEKWVDAHEESAEVAWIFGIVAGVIGLGGLLVSRRMREVPALVMGVALTALLASMFFFAKTANLGGQIIHTETRGDSISKFFNSDD